MPIWAVVTPSPNTVVKDWLERVERESDLQRIPLSFQDRTGHLPHLPHDVIARLNLSMEPGQELGAVTFHALINC